MPLNRSIFKLDEPGKKLGFPGSSFFFEQHVGQTKLKSGKLRATQDRLHANLPILEQESRPFTRICPQNYQGIVIAPPRRRSAPPQKNRVRINDKIRAEKVRVVAPDGEHGIYALEDALALADKHNLDLVEISPNAKPPVCKIIDYGKYQYEQQKKEKEARKKSHTVSLKEIRFRPRTDTHDFEFKTKHARQFLTDGNMVKAWVQFRGRDILYKDQGEKLLTRFTEALQDVGKVDQRPKMEGRRMTIIMTPLKKKA